MCKCDGSCKSKITDEDIAKAVHTIFDKDDACMSFIGVVGAATYQVSRAVDKRVEEYIRNSPDFKVTETKNPFGVSVQVQRIKR